MSAPDFRASDARATPHPAASTWQRLVAAWVPAFRAYAKWLVGISWKRFAVLSLLLLILASILERLPPFSWRITEEVERGVRVTIPPVPPKPPSAPRPATSPPTTEPTIDITIGKEGVRVLRRGPSSAASAASAASASSAASAADPAQAAAETIVAKLPAATASVPPGADADELRQTIEEGVREIADAIREASDATQQSAADASAADADPDRPRTRTRTVHVGDFLTDLAVLWIIASAIIKITYSGRLQAETVAAQATEVAEAESLKRQVVEARMAAMQAQVEPHFLFNTLASIDHLIETDPPRASRMQKNLIALLRASMPTMREASTGGVRELGRELAVIRPYLEILKVRMEERLQTVIDVPEGLHSAEFPPMMIQGLVENAIKHGLEPKPEGGQLTVRAEIVHGKLAVTVADTGLGFGKAATAGTGVGLANIRERLQLLYGGRAAVAVAANQPSGTIVTITVPYVARTRPEATESAA